MKRYVRKFEEGDKWYDLDDNSIKKLNSLNKPFSSSLRRDVKLGKDILNSIVSCVERQYDDKLSFQEIFSLIKKVVNDTTISDFNWDDDDLKTSIESIIK